MKNLIIRTITGVLFVAVMVTCFLEWRAMSLLFTIITALTIWEYCGLVNEHVQGARVNRLICTVAGAYFFLAMMAFRTGLANFVVFVPYVLSVIYLFVSELYLRNDNPLACWAYTALSQMYVAMPLSLINILAFENGVDGTVHFDTLLPLSIFIFLWLNDTGAYCFGSMLGRHKLFPRISPGKTWEGSIGGAVVVIIAAGLLGYYANSRDPHTLDIAGWFGLGITVVVFGTWGDLVESLFKRTIGIKDSGRILPGHGGMLDRFDSSLLAIPAAVLFLYSWVLLQA